MQLEGKVALVTGAASGIGAAVAARLARAGALVAIADLDFAAAETVAISLGRDVAVAVAMDVTDEAQVEAGVAAAVQRYGRLDILVSNAGVQHVAPLVELSFEDWRRVTAIHLDAAFLTTRSAMRAMQAQGGGGSIIYMGSVHSKEASPYKAPYVAAKHALIGLAKVVANEGAADGIRANVVCPGFVLTPLVQRQIPEHAARLGISEEAVRSQVLLKDTVDGEFTTVEDVAEAVLFFASFGSNALTGQPLVVSHGWSMQ
nr:3-hydroxybutyrate dehydrogenase [uncultured Lichenicoccus sp.]